MDVTSVKEKFVSPLLAILAIAAFLPGLSIMPVHAQSAMVSVSPAVNAADVGQSFMVDVVLDMSDTWVAYDVKLLFNNAALNTGSVNFDGPGTVFNGMSHFNVAQIDSDETGEVRSASTLLGGASLAGGSYTLMQVTFTVVGTQDSALDLVETEIVALDLNGNTMSIIPALNDGQFFVPPNVVFNLTTMTLGDIAAQTVSPGQRSRVLSRGETFVDVRGFIQLDPSALRAAFGGVRFTVVDPANNMYTADSAIVFLFPGQTATVPGTVSYDGVLGTYRVFVTVLRCAGSDVSSCVEGDSTSGKFFKVRA